VHGLAQVRTVTDLQRNLSIPSGGVHLINVLTAGARYLLHIPLLSAVIPFAFGIRAAVASGMGRDLADIMLG